MRICPSLLEEIERQAEEALPAEACGLLVGNKNGEDILRAIPSPNRAQGRNEFLIDPVIHLNLQRKLRAAGQEVIGVYHSHPGGDSWPSKADRKGVSSPGFYWLITAIDKNGAKKSSLFCENPTNSDRFSRNFNEVPLQILKNQA